MVWGQHRSLTKTLMVSFPCSTRRRIPATHQYSFLHVGLWDIKAITKAGHRNTQLPGTKDTKETKGQVLKVIADDGTKAVLGLGVETDKMHTCFIPYLA